jgi:Zn-dependent protease with chaperone function
VGLLTAEGIALLGLAVLLAGPVPALLARASWPGRSPRAALVLWQSVGLGGGLAILGAGLTLAVSGLRRSWLGGLGALPRAAGESLGLAGPRPRSPAPHPGAHVIDPGHVIGLGGLGWAGVALTVVTGGWLLAVLAVSTVRLTLARRAHRQRLDLLADELAVDELPVPAGGRAGAGRGAPVGGVRVRLLDHPLAAAYCLPGVRPRIVLSRGVIDALSHAELCAVVSHEKAHARGRHDLVIQPFRAWRQTFPFLAAGRAALASVELLVELAADNAAVRRGHGAALASALRALAATTEDDTQVRARQRRLAGAPRPLSRLAAGAVCAAAVALVCLPPAILIAA